ncbi:MAG: hypothetical protein WBH85_16020 [Thermoanaerobaculia bacterium]
MKQALTSLVSIAVLLLCWAALDDITTGTEPNYFLEWTMVGAGIIWYGGLIAVWRWNKADT